MHQHHQEVVNETEVLNPASLPSASTTLVTAGLVATALAQGKTRPSLCLWMTAGPSDQAVFENYAKLYEQANPSVSVQPTFVTLPQLSQKLQLMIAGNTPPDVARVVTANIAQFGSLATDLTGTIDPKDFLATQVPYIKSGKKIIGAPLDATVTALYYNKDCFNEAGIKAPSNVKLPWTWEQWRSAMETVTKKSKCRFALSWDATTHRFSSTLYQAGGRYIGATRQEFRSGQPGRFAGLYLLPRFVQRRTGTKRCLVVGRRFDGLIQKRFDRHVYGNQWTPWAACTDQKLCLGSHANATG